MTDRGGADPMADFDIPKEWPVYSDGFRYMTYNLPREGIGGMIWHQLYGRTEGNVFALLPADADERFIYAFTRSYRVDHLDNVTDFDPYVFDEVSRTMARGGQAFVYDTHVRLDDSDWYRDQNNLLYGDQVLFGLGGDALEHGFTYATSSNTTQDCLVLCSESGRRPAEGTVLSEPEAEEIIASTRVIFARAYDGGSWLVWRLDASAYP